MKGGNAGSLKLASVEQEPMNSESKDVCEPSLEQNQRNKADTLADPKWARIGSWQARN
jgi:hypothetical protein